jgi:hypothetical protein
MIQLLRNWSAVPHHEADGLTRKDAASRKERMGIPDFERYLTTWQFITFK